MNLLNLLAFAPTGGENGEGGGGMMGMLIMLIPMALIFYFMIMRPNKKRKAEEQKLRDNLAIGDEIITIGGICGRVISKKEDNTLIIETGTCGSQIKITAQCVARIVTVKD